MFSNFNNLDYLVTAVFCLSVFFGFIKGFIGSLVSSVGWVVSLYVAYVVLPYSASVFDKFTNNPVLSAILGYGVVFILSLIISAFINFFISGIISFLNIGLLDRILGLGFGALRGVAIIGLVYLGFMISWDLLYSHPSSGKTKHPMIIESAVTYPYIIESKNILVNIIPALNQGNLEALLGKVIAQLPKEKDGKGNKSISSKISAGDVLSLLEAKKAGDQQQKP